MTMRDEIGLEQARKLMMNGTGETMKIHIDNNIESINSVMDESNKAKLSKLNQQIRVSNMTFFYHIDGRPNCDAYVWLYVI